jgi:hypothetical protein
MARRTIESEARKLLEAVQKGKITLAKAAMMIEDLDEQMMLSVKAVADSKAARQRRRNPNLETEPAPPKRTLAILSSWWL